MKLDQIQSVIPEDNWILEVSFVSGLVGVFDVKPHLSCEAFEELQDPHEFIKIYNGSYYIEWGCGADLSADTLRACLKTLTIDSNSN